MIRHHPHHFVGDCAALEQHNAFQDVDGAQDGGEGGRHHQPAHQCRPPLREVAIQEEVSPGAMVRLEGYTT